MVQSNTDSVVQVEMSRAKAARASGNEGMARVCARRAVGYAIRRFFQDQGIEVRDPSAVSLLAQLIEIEKLPEHLVKSAEKLLQRVNANHQLAPGVDLIEAAENIISSLNELDNRHGGNHER